MSQFELFSQPVVQPSTEPSVDAVRARLDALLKSLRQADVMPLSERKLAYWTTVVPQTSRWLPDDERAAVLVEFSAHVDRLSRHAA